MQYADMCLKYALNVISMKKTPSFSNAKRDSHVQFRFFIRLLCKAETQNYKKKIGAEDCNRATNRSGCQDK